MKYIAVLLLVSILCSCDTTLQPEIISVEGKEYSESIDPIIEHPKLITPIDSLQTEYAKILSRIDYEGRVIVEFIIDKKGSVEDPQIVSGGNSVINQEVKELIKTLKFEPGKQRGKPVKVRYSIPLKLTY